MIVPKKIKTGDKVGVISTARKISMEELCPAIKILESWGLNVVLGKYIFEQQNQFAGTIDQRRSDLQNMISDDSISAIFCARGGYGTIQIIDQIDFSKLENNPKWIIGYSDITILHSHLNTLGIASMHSTMPINYINNTTSSLNSLKESIFELSNSTISSPTHSLNKFGRVKANLVGGNLSILYSLLGSKSDINTDQKILFLEDLDEYLYHIERMIISMKRNGKFENLKGMIVGEMINMHDNKVSFGRTAEEIIFNQIEEYDFPICFGFPSGHINDNRTLKFGLNSILNIRRNSVSLSQ